MEIEKKPSESNVSSDYLSGWKAKVLALVLIAILILSIGYTFFTLFVISVVTGS